MTFDSVSSITRLVSEILKERAWASSLLEQTLSFAKELKPPVLVFFLEAWWVASSPYHTSFDQSASPKDQQLCQV